MIWNQLNGCILVYQEFQGWQKLPLEIPDTFEYSALRIACVGSRSNTRISGMAVINPPGLRGGRGYE